VLVATILSMYALIYLPNSSVACSPFPFRLSPFTLKSANIHGHKTTSSFNQPVDKPFPLIPLDNVGNQINFIIDA